MCVIFKNTINIDYFSVSNQQDSMNLLQVQVSCLLVTQKMDFTLKALMEVVLMVFFNLNMKIFAQSVPVLDLLKPIMSSVSEKQKVSKLFIIYYLIMLEI